MSPQSNVASISGRILSWTGLQTVEGNRRTVTHQWANGQKPHRKSRRFTLCGWRAKVTDLQLWHSGLVGCWWRCLVWVSFCRGSRGQLTVRKKQLEVPVSGSDQLPWDSWQRWGWEEMALLNRYVLVQYDVAGPVLWHERLPLEHLGGDEYIIVTPDSDIYPRGALSSEPRPQRSPSESSQRSSAGGDSCGWDLPPSQLDQCRACRDSSWVGLGPYIGVRVFTRRSLREPAWSPKKGFRIFHQHQKMGSFISSMSITCTLGTLARRRC